MHLIQPSQVRFPREVLAKDASLFLGSFLLNLRVTGKGVQRERYGGGNGIVTLYKNFDL